MRKIIRDIGDGYDLLKDYLKPHKKWGILGGVFLFLSVGLMLPIPIILKIVVDGILESGVDFLPKFSLIMLGLLVALLVQLIASVMEDYTFTVFRERVARDLKVSLFNSFLHSSYEKTRNMKSGYLVTRIESDCDNLGGIMADTFFSTIKEIAILAAAMFMLFYLDFHLALIVLLILPPFLITNKIFGPRLRKIANEVREQSADFRGVLQEMVSMFILFKSYAAEKFALKKVEEPAARVADISIKMQMLSSIASAIAGFFTAVAPVILLWVGGIEIIKGRLSFGAWVAFNNFVGYVFQPAASLTNLNVKVQKSFAALDRVREIMKMAEDDHEKSGEDKTIELVRSAEEPITESNYIEIKNLSFSYDGNRNAVDRVNLKIQKGEAMAVIGPSGSGKSTMFSLVSGLDKPSEGVVLINGRTPNLQDSHQLTLVHQQAHLFSGTLKENITLGKEDPGDEKLMKVIELTGLKEVLDRLDSGMDSIIGEHGSTLSGGEKQRVAIARALFVDPEILILDEALSQLDEVSTNLIRKNILSARVGKTTIFIVHRLSGIDVFDRILLLNEGRVEGNGKHEELLSQNYLYRELYLQIENKKIEDESEPLLENSCQ